MVEDWRCRYSLGQHAQCRLVISEMLNTKNSSSQPVCAHFMQIVTGCSLSIVKVVQEEMLKTGGIWTPKPRKLRRRRGRPRKQMIEVEVEIDDEDPTEITQSGDRSK